MPSQPTAKGFPCKPEDCHVSRHLEGPDYKVHDVMCAAAPPKNGKRVFFASVQPWLCNALNQSRSAVDASLSRLQKAGWLIKHDGGRKNDGKKAPNVYEVLEHDEFVATHPNSCPPYQFAPDWEEASKFGLQKGDKLRSGINDRALRFLGIDLKKEFRALAEVFEAMTDEERAQLEQRLRTEQPECVTITLKRRRAATPGRQEVADDSHSLSTVAGRSLSTGSGSPLSTVTGRSLSTVQNLTPELTQHNTHTHLTNSKPGVFGVENTFDEEMLRLQDEMAKYEDLAGKATEGQKSKLRELFEKNGGREVFRAAVRAWLAEHPWNANTTDPLLALIGGFPTYAKKKKYADQKDAQRKAVENDKNTKLRSKMANAHSWCKNEFAEADYERLTALLDKERLTANDFKELAEIDSRRREPEPEPGIESF